MKTLIALLALVATLTINAAEQPSFIERIGVDTIAIGRSPDLERMDFSAGIRLSYDLTERFAVVLEAEGADFHGVLVDSALAGVKFGFPGKTVTPYIIAAGVIKFPSNDEFGMAGAGLEFALGKSWCIFAEVAGEKGIRTDTELRVTSGVGFRF